MSVDYAGIITYSNWQKERAEKNSGHLLLTKKSGGSIVVYGNENAVHINRLIGEGESSGDLVLDTKSPYFV
jgi:hypothetical protein